MKLATKLLKITQNVLLRGVIPFGIIAMFYLWVELGTDFLDGSAPPALVVLSTILLTLWVYHFILDRLTRQTKDTQEPS